jgi:hypothetical protein
LATLAAVCISTLAHAHSDVISVDSTFSPTSRKESRVFNKQLTTVEEGTMNGIKYEFHLSDASGTSAGTQANDIQSSSEYAKNWHLSCKKDVMTDRVTCKATKESLTIFYTKELGFVVAIMEQRYPGSSVSIRVDNGQVFSSNDAVFPPQVSAKILAQIKDGSKVATRYVSWPEKANMDRVSDVYGASVAAAYIKWAFGQIK